MEPEEILPDHNEEYLIVDETADLNEAENNKLKVLVVDDDEEVHNVTKIVIGTLKYEGHGLQILSAFSAAEAKKILMRNPDIAVILLDVIMEKEDSGLHVAKFIRDNLENRLIRIIIRTGQPGQIPEEEAILKYDINDYKEKTELTAIKLRTCVITALRSYKELNLLDHTKRTLERAVIDADKIFRAQDRNELIKNVFDRFCGVVSDLDDKLKKGTSGFLLFSKDSENKILQANGEFTKLLDTNLEDSIDKVPGLKLDIVNGKKGLVIESQVLYAKFFIKDGSSFFIYVKRSEPIIEWERDLIAITFSNIYVAIESMDLSDEILQTQKEIIYTLGDIAEARSKETGNHVKRVAQISAILAKYYGISKEDIEILIQAAPIHDIGKLAIPDDILNKPGKLTTEEFDVMKTHTLIGYDMLKTSSRSILKLAAIIALQHHEKYDGNGYPYGLKGEDIDIYARIVAVADVFDALSHSRVYKDAWEPEAVIAYFKENRGKHFDPKLVDILLENTEEIFQIKNIYPD